MNVTLSSWFTHQPGGHLFIFRNKRGDRLKLLYWDRDGYAIWYKRLEEGSFRFPAQGGDGDGIEIPATDLAMILEGIDLASVKRHKRYRRPEPAVVATDC